ncbi:MAG: hypothetical protein KGJ62_04435 [Armatimonadetes bacterium]|nr:hypothetical protein [Armatimonadota bacterium]MDE2207044.1 hypothetical protein [Armatimonadota bacterium]
MPALIYYLNLSGLTARSEARGRRIVVKEDRFDWPLCPQATDWVDEQLHGMIQRAPAIGLLADRILQRCGVRIVNLIDHLTLPETAESRDALTAAGFVERATVDGDSFWLAPGGRVARVRLDAEVPHPCLCLSVESLDTWLTANAMEVRKRGGDPGADYEEAWFGGEHEGLGVAARRGYAGFRSQHLSHARREAIEAAAQAFDARERGGDETDVIQAAGALFTIAAGRIGLARAVDEFFASERRCYMRRNAAARWMYDRQRELGFEWANHDHHTYRSSRAAFRALQRLWIEMGFQPRERFYAGAEAGWGAQVLEHPVSRVVIFSDVDVAPDELDLDFANQDLPERNVLGTIGLWCAMHASSIAAAGMHHLEAEYDFEAASAVLRNAGFGLMAPFTDLPMLKQLFTEPEIWPIASERIGRLRESGMITADEAARFGERGAPGSHLEILQRWSGFKGFNKTGVSAIILATDARRAGV